MEKSRENERLLQVERWWREAVVTMVAVEWETNYNETNAGFLMERKIAEF